MPYIISGIGANKQRKYFKIIFDFYLQIWLFTKVLEIVKMNEIKYSTLWSSQLWHQNADYDASHNWESKIAFRRFSWLEYSQIANRRGTFINFSKFSDPLELIRTPAYWFSRNNFWSGRFYNWLAIFSILLKRKHLFDFYLKHFYLTLFIYKPYQW